MLTASDAELQRAAQLQAQALRCVPDTAVLGPLPTQQDLAAAAAAAVQDGNAAGPELSDTSANTVPFSLLRAPPVFSSTLCIRAPEGVASDLLASPVSDALGDSTAAQTADADTSNSRKRRQEEAAEAVSTVAAALEGTARLWLLQEQQWPGGKASSAMWGEGAVCVCIEAVTQGPDAQQAQADTQQQQQQVKRHASMRATLGAAAGQPEWKRVAALLPQGHLQQPPILLQSSLQLLPGCAEGSSDPAGGSDSTAATAGASAAQPPDGPAGSTEGSQQLHVALAGRAWDELQALVQEQPVGDLAGAAKHWCTAVKAVATQH
jgi:hypothetical protein